MSSSDSTYRNDPYMGNVVDEKHTDMTRPQEDRRHSIIGAKSPGVARIEAISSVLTKTDRVFMFLGVFLLAFAYDLDGVTRYVYTGYATASYNTHSLLATVNVVRAVIAAAAQPTAAKIADVFGRFELVLISTFFYVIGTIVEATATGVSGFAGGAVLYQIGFTCVILLVEVIIGDVTSLRSRLLFSYIPAAPYLITTWVSGNITAAVLSGTTWNWGIGMWAIIYPVCALPLLTILWIVGRRARKQGVLDTYKSPFQMLGPRQLFMELFWQLDVIGIILLIAMLGLILAPLTLAGGFVDKWKDASIIAPLVVGICVVPVFFFWESRAKHPLVPFHLLKDRAVWAALGIACTLNWAWYMQGDFLYAVLIVAFDFSVADATRITGLYSFCSVLAGIILGFIVFKVRQLKWFIVAGGCLFMVAFGMLIHYRGSPDGKAGVIGAEVVLGIAGGMFPYPTQASIQAATKHEHMAVVTGLYLALYSVGSAFGYCVSGAMWTQVLPRYLDQNLASTGNATLAAAVYANPYLQAATYPVGTPERAGMIAAYQEAQRLLCIVGICICVPLIGFALLLRNPTLGKEQSLPDAEENNKVFK